MIRSDRVNGDFCTVVASDARHFREMRSDVIDLLLDAPVIHTGRWQQLDISQSAAHGTHELLNVTCWYDMPETPQQAQQFIRPDLPWAEGHFRERVSGEPVNPGEWHDRWPYHAGRVDLHQKGGKYDHNYMERFWAKGLRYDDELHNRNSSPTAYPFTGYRFAVGDLADVVKQLQRDPTTRQAYLPMWFPEDTGATASQRVPCSLGYHFIIRDGTLHVSYWLRSCEIYRHFTNDVYMAVRLGQWMRDQCEVGLTYSMGQLTMNIVSLHAFVGDVPAIRKMQ
jgi:Thymidylate synthase